MRMTAFYAAYRNEMDKFFLRRKYTALIIVGVIACILLHVLGSVATNFIGQRSGIGIILMPTPQGLLPFLLRVVMPLIVFMCATDCVTAEASDLSIRATITRPVERWKVYSAKLFAILSYAFVYMVLIFLASIVSGLFFGNTPESLLISIVSYLLAIPTLAVLISFAMFIAVLGRSITLTLVVLVIMYAIMSLLPLIFPVMSNLLFTSYLAWHRFWVGISPGFRPLMHIITILLGYGTVFFTSGSLIFDKQEY